MIVIIQLHLIFPDPHNSAIFTHHEKDLVMLTFLCGLGLAPCLILLMWTLDRHHFLAGCLQPSLLDCSIHCLLSNQFLSHHQSHLLKSYQGVRAPGRRRIWVNKCPGVLDNICGKREQVCLTLCPLHREAIRTFPIISTYWLGKGQFNTSTEETLERKIRSPRLFSAI